MVVTTPEMDNLTDEQKRALKEVLVYLSAGVRGDDKTAAIEDSLLALEAAFGQLTMTQLSDPEDVYATPKGTQVHVRDALWERIATGYEDTWQTRSGGQVVDEATSPEFFERVCLEQPQDVARWGYGDKEV